MKAQFNSLFCFLLIMIASTSLFAKDSLLNDSINYSQNKNILRSFYRFQIQNDYNLFTGKSDDRGFTVGGGHYFRKVNYEKIKYFDVSVTSNLYTDFIPNSLHFVNGQKIYNQNFNEINTLNFSVSNYSEKLKIFKTLGGGIGITNKKKPIPGFALYFQGGSDGFGGIHKYLFDDLNYNSIASGPIKPFVFLNPSLTKHYVVNNKLWKYNKPFIEIKGGVSIGTPEIQSNLFLNYFSEIPLLQFNSKTNKVFRIAGLLGANTIVHSTGVLFNPEIGAIVSIYNFDFKYSVYQQIGVQQTEVIKYFDNEPIMTLSLQMNFNNK